jgi:hypothetical protein
MRCTPAGKAALRNAAISLLRLSGHTSIARALRHHARDPQRPVELDPHLLKPENAEALVAWPGIQNNRADASGLAV